MSFRRARSAPGARRIDQMKVPPRIRRRNMDMRKYGSSTFIGVEDLRDGPRQETIASIADGKFNKPVATFESGDKLSLNVTKVNTVIKAYGPNDEDWIGRVVELAIGSANYNGEPIETVVVRPVSPPKPLAARTPVQKRPSRKPDFDDDISF
jgi:hypothetical protein